jgi:hypothetical protein
LITIDSVIVLGNVLKVGPDFSRLKLSKMELEVFSGQYRLNPAIEAVWDGEYSDQHM